VALCQYRPNLTEGPGRADRRAPLGRRGALPFWEAHSTRVDDDFVSSRAPRGTGRSAGTSRSHLVAQRSAVPSQRGPALLSRPAACPVAGPGRSGDGVRLASCGDEHRPEPFAAGCRRHRVRSRHRPVRPLRGRVRRVPRRRLEHRRRHQRRPAPGRRGNALRQTSPTRVTPTRSRSAPTTCRRQWADRRRHDRGGPTRSQHVDRPPSPEQESGRRAGRSGCVRSPPSATSPRLPDDVRTTAEEPELPPVERCVGSTSPRRTSSSARRCSRVRPAAGPRHRRAGPRTADGSRDDPGVAADGRRPGSRTRSHCCWRSTRCRR